MSELPEERAVETRAHLLPEEIAAGSDNPEGQAEAILDESLERTLHGVDVMTSILRSGETGEFVTLTTTCTRPEALGITEAQALLR